MYRILGGSNQPPHNSTAVFSHHGNGMVMYGVLLLPLFPRLFCSNVCCADVSTFTEHENRKSPTGAIQNEQKPSLEITGTHSRPTGQRPNQQLRQWMLTTSTIRMSPSNNPPLSQNLRWHCTAQYHNVDGFKCVSYPTIS